MISFKCPHCQKAYKLKDEYAGKRTACQACRKPLIVPPPAAAASAATATRAADAEAIAAAALADAPAAPTAEKTFRHKCQFCDAENEFPVSKAGKNAPCPECGRIIRLPLPSDGKKKDWRQANLPAGAREAHNVPEDVMTSARKTFVSGEAMEKAGAMPIEKEPTDWARVGKIAGLAGGLLVIVGVLGFVFWPKKAERNAKWIHSAVEMVNAKDSKVTAPGMLAVLAAAGQYATAVGQADEAARYFQQARGRLDDIKPEEKRPAAIELALATAELAGVGEYPSEQKRQEQWNNTREALRQTLGRINTPDDREARLTGLRLLTRAWIAKQQGARLADVARQVASGEEQADALAAVAIELLPTDRAKAEELAIQAQQALTQSSAAARPTTPTPAAPGTPPAPTATPKPANPPPHLIALWWLLDKLDKARALAPEPDGKTEPSAGARQGYAEGYARKLEWAKARALATAPGAAPDRLRAIAAVAAAAVAGIEGPNTEGPAILEDAARLAESEPKNKPLPVWPLLRLTELSVQAGKPDLANRFLALLDAGSKGWGQLVLLRARLAGPETPEPAWAEAVGTKDSLAQALAFRDLARRLAEPSEAAAVQQVETWDEPRRAVGYAGIALAAIPK